MKIIIFIISFFILPTIAFSAYNDATLTTDTVISVGDYTLNVSGSSAVVESITINSSDFSVTLASGSSITITSPTRNQLTTDVSTGVTNTCNSTISSLAITGTGTVTITPSSTICVDAVSTPTPTSTSIQTSGSSSGGSSSASAQIRNLISMGNYQLAQQIANQYNLPTLGVTPTILVTSLTRTLTVGQKGTDVKTLQQYLNYKGFTVATSGPGSKGNETTMFGGLTRSALARFQKANKIYPAVGYFGPITRKFIQNNP